MSEEYELTLGKQRE